MLAAFYSKTGPAREVFSIAEVNMPHPGHGEVRVRVHTSGINPADVKRRAGENGRPLLFPIVIPHSDGAGVIEAVGPGVQRSREGEVVWLWNTQWQRPFGTAAQFAIVPSPQAVVLPSNVNFELGSALGVPALTAHRCIATLGNIRDHHIMIHGGAGVIGQFAIQIAKARGAIVCATVSDKERARFAKSAGADHVLNYRTDSFLDEATSLTGASGFDHILDVDMGANGGSYTRLLRKYGSVVIFGSASNMRPHIDVLPLQLHGVSLHFVSGSEQRPEDRVVAIEEVTNLLQEGHLSMRIEARYGLQDVAAAHERVEAGRLTGKVLLDLSGRH